MISIITAIALTMAPVPIEAPPLVDLSTPAQATKVAERLDPPVAATATPPTSFTTASTNTTCVGALGLLAFYSPGWDVNRMARIMHRESRCEPGAWNRRGQAAGLLQITPTTYRYLRECLGEDVYPAKLFNPEFNVRAAACLWQDGRYGPWAL